MANDNNFDQENDGSPSNNKLQDAITPTSKQSFSEHFPQNDQPSISDLRQHAPSIGTEASLQNEKQCFVCQKKFGMRRMRRKHTCRRCDHKVCGSCSSKKRYDAKTEQLVRVCDICLQPEHCIVMTHRLRNLKLKHNKRNRGTYIVKVAQSSKEYNEGLVNKCKIIEINEQNVESLNAQLIADKLNTIKIPFSITLDYKEAEIKHDQLKKLKRNRMLGNDPNHAKSPTDDTKANGNVDDKAKGIQSKQNNNKNKDVNKEIGAGQLMNCHQNPMSSYYYGPPQQFQPPVIVTGPSNDIRQLNAYQQQQQQVNVIQQSYSDSGYNEPNYYDQRGNRGESGNVIYENSTTQKKQYMDETDDETSSEDNSDEEDSDDTNDDDSEEEEDDTRNQKDVTPELMQYSDDSVQNGEDNALNNSSENNDREPISNGNGNINANVNGNFKEEKDDDTKEDMDSDQKEPQNPTDENDIDDTLKLPRSKSVPSTPVLTAVNTTTTPQPQKAQSVTTTPALNEDMSPMKLNGNTNANANANTNVITDDKSKTPRGDQLTSPALTANGSRKKRSMSQDHNDPTSAPIMPLPTEQQKNLDVKHDMLPNGSASTGQLVKDKEKKKKFLKRKKKEKKEKKNKKKKVKDKPQLEDELTMKSNTKKPGFFRRKSRQKHMENYQNLHNNIHGSNLNENQPVISSNVRDYTTQTLHPPNYNMMNGGHDRRNVPKPPPRGGQSNGMPSPQRRVNMNVTMQQQPSMTQQQYMQYTQRNVQRQRREMQQHIASSDHMLVNPYRQFSIAFNKRPFHLKVQYRNGFNAFMNPSSHHIQQSNTLTRPQYIWGWYSVERHKNIPIGSKLISINFEWIYGKNQQEIAELMYNSPLPVTLIFEAPSYLNHIPPSIYIQLNDEEEDTDEEDKEIEKDKMENIQIEKNKEFSIESYLETKKSIIFWWLEEGGAVMIALAILALMVLENPWYIQLQYYLPIITAFVTVLCMSIPPRELYNMIWSLIHMFFLKVGKRRKKGSGLILFGHRIFYGAGKSVSYNNPHVTIATDQSLLNPFDQSMANVESQPRGLSSRRSVPATSSQYTQDVQVSESPRFAKRRKKDKHHKKKAHKEEKEREIEEKKYNEDELENEEDDMPNIDDIVAETLNMKELDLIEDEDDKEEKEELQIEENEEDLIDPNWETEILHPDGATEIWGAYGPCSSKTLKLRGPTYLTDKIKIASEETLLSLANMDIFTVHNRIHHMAQNEVSWFHQNRKKLPRSLFFLIFHLRLDSMTASVVQYFYIDKNKFKHLLEQNDKIKKMAKEKGDGYFVIGGNGFDESGMFWNFINGPCRYRNDRLKLLARKEEGPWYMQIPTRPAILGRQVPIEYYRGYNGKHLNSLKVHSTRSHAYEPYDFKTLYHDPDKKPIIGNPIREEQKPCDCGKCLWVNTDGEYPDYLEIDITPEVNSVAKNTVRIACPLAKSLQVEMHWTMEGQINNVELPERMLAAARLIHVDLSKLIELD